MVSCAACGCSRTPKNIEKGITFHRFPKDAEKKRAWIKALNKSESDLTTNSCLCSEHFAPDCFDRTSQSKLRLLPSAVPTIEVSRLKNVRTYTTTTKSQIEIPEETLATITKLHDVEASGTSTMHDIEAPGTSTMHDIEAPGTSTMHDIEAPGTSTMHDIEAPGTSTMHDIEALGSSTIEDTPRKRKLKRTISELQGQSLMKSHKIRRLQKQVWYKKRQIHSLKAMVGHLKDKNLILEEQHQLFLEQFGENKNVIQRLFQKSRGQPVSKIYDQSTRSFAITLHYYSPKAYDYVRQKFKNCLPHPKTLAKWYSSVNAQPGFTTESFNFLKIKMLHIKRPLVCAVVFDEMSIRKHLEFDGKKYHGFVDCGNGLNGDAVDLAKDVLVFMLVCLNEPWKLPLGYFFIAGINAEQKAELTKQCLSLLYDTGIVVASITFDGCAANLTMCRLLGCSFDPNNLITDVLFENRKQFVLPDPAHMVKLIRNCFGDLGKLCDMNNNIIDFNYVVKLNDLQTNEGLHLGNKLRSQHIKFFKQKMKVKLATQLLSRSVADSLMYCKDNLKLKDFQNCSATAQFIYIINDAFDVLNSRKLSLPKFKKAACASNIREIEQFYINFKNYVLQLKRIDGTPILETNRKTGFLGFLIGLKTLLGMWSELVEKNNFLAYIPMYKCSQDHVELFFSSIRSQGGYNNNPTCRQFTSAYKKLVIHAEVRDGGAGNCIPLEQIHILNVSSLNKPPEQIINESLPNQKLIAEIEMTEPEFDTYSFLNDHTYAFHCDSLSIYSAEVVTYIAGFVSNKLSKKLKCEQCVLELFGDKENFLNSLISVKSYGGLKYPSMDLVNICKKAEKLLRIEQNKSIKINKNKIIIEVLAHYQHKDIFKNHDKGSTNNHYGLLIKSIANIFLDTRIHFICRSQQSDIVKIRSQMTKLILFKGQ